MSVAKMSLGVKKLKPKAKTGLSLLSFFFYGDFESLLLILSIFVQVAGF